jgi:hypothetical protein
MLTPRRVVAENRLAATRELCRRHGISEQTFYRSKAKFDGMEVSGACPGEVLRATVCNEKSFRGFLPRADDSSDICDRPNLCQLIYRILLTVATA